MTCPKPLRVLVWPGLEGCGTWGRETWGEAPAPFRTDSEAPTAFPLCPSRSGVGEAQAWSLGGWARPSGLLACGHRAGRRNTALVFTPAALAAWNALLL